MSHTFSNLLFHVLFSTKGRARLLSREIRTELFAYMGGVIRDIGGKALLVNGVADHVHLLVRLPAEIAVADSVRTVKANSSKWIHEKWPSRASFAWQIGYTAFTVSLSQRDRVYKYIAGQEQHHRKTSFADELRFLLEKHGGNVAGVLEDYVAPEGAHDEVSALTHS